MNDSITVLDDASSDHSSLALIAVDHPGYASQNPAPLSESLTATVELHSQGLHFGLSAQGDEIMTLLLTDPIPCQQLNSLLYSALHPMLASVGPWIGGYGTRHGNMHVAVQITSSTTRLHFSSSAQPSNAPIPNTTSSVLIEEITDTQEVQTVVPTSVLTEEISKPEPGSHQEVQATALALEATVRHASDHL